MAESDRPAGVAVDRGVRPHARTLADHIEQRMRTWRQQHMNRSGDRLALDDFMGEDSIADLVDFVCDEYAMPMQKPLTAQQLDKLIEAYVGGTELADGEYSAMVLFAAAVERAHGIGASRPLTWEQAVRSTITDSAVAERILSVPHDATPEQARELLRRPGA